MHIWVNCNPGVGKLLFYSWGIKPSVWEHYTLIYKGNAFGVCRPAARSITRPTNSLKYACNTMDTSRRHACVKNVSQTRR